MKRSIYFLRHAKSSWETGVEDLKRPLNTRGKKDALLLANFVAQHLKRPDYAAVSVAARTRQTAQYFIDAYNMSDDRVLCDATLYDFSGESVLRFIKTLDPIHKIVMLVGHNHAFTALVNMLGDKRIDHVPTCGMTVIDFKCDNWQTISRGTTRETIFPRDFK
jgi:phosphohistidine phosphatase